MFFWVFPRRQILVGQLQFDAGEIPKRTYTILKYLKSILIVFNISNFDKEINKEPTEDDLIEDRNVLECFLRCFK